LGKLLGVWKLKTDIEFDFYLIFKIIFHFQMIIDSLEKSNKIRRRRSNSIQWKCDLKDCQASYKGNQGQHKENYTNCQKSAQTWFCRFAGFPGSGCLKNVTVAIWCFNY
jgi:hypothetical protein